MGAGADDVSASVPLAGRCSCILSFPDVMFLEVVHPDGVLPDALLVMPALHEQDARAYIDVM